MKKLIAALVYGIASMTLITMQGGVPEGKTPPLPVLEKP